LRTPIDLVVGLVGDGAMQMNNMAELITVAKYWREWVDPCWVMCVFNNEDLNQVTWEQRVMEGDPKFDASQNIPNVPYHRFAEMIGLKGIYIDDAEKLGSAWDEALAAKRPVVLEVKTDPEVPPLPPHITLDQAKKFSMSLAKGESSAGNAVAGAARQLFSAILPDHQASWPYLGGYVAPHVPSRRTSRGRRSEPFFSSEFALKSAGVIEYACHQAAECDVT